MAGTNRRPRKYWYPARRYGLRSPLGMTNRFLVSLVGVLVAVQPTAGGAESVAPAIQRWHVRADTHVYYQDFFKDPAPEEATNGFSAVTVARDLVAASSVEGLVGRGYWNGNHRDTGWQLMLLGRYSLRTASGVHGLSVAAGPSVALGGDYGTVVFLQTELAYELRLHIGFNLILGGGPGVALMSSQQPYVSCGARLCDYFHQGNVGGRVHLGLGWSF
jgi:hypothetical protein